jgi:hypothetical protein
MAPDPPHGYHWSNHPCVAWICPHRIGVRVVDGIGAFSNNLTDEKFINKSPLKQK